jgi:DNA-binding LacI/PurR family transcriptional regulator
MRERPTAALLVNETMVVGLYRRLIEAGLAPGRDLAIIAFQEEPNARFLSPRVTCFRSELRALGVRLGEALLSAMPASGPAEGHGLVQEIWPMKLVVGESDGEPGAMMAGIRERDRA